MQEGYAISSLFPPKKPSCIQATIDLCGCDNIIYIIFIMPCNTKRPA